MGNRLNIKYLKNVFDQVFIFDEAEMLLLI